MGQGDADVGQEAWKCRGAAASFRRGAGGGGLGLALRLLFSALLVEAGPGCSLILTKGPEPELHPPPECTTSAAAPVVDTILAATAVALAVAGFASTSPSCSSNDFGCGIGKGTGEALGVAGAALGVLFGVSAGVGYGRTSACRASLGPGYVPAPTQLTPAPEASLWPPTPSPGCALQGDAPRVCTLARPPDGPWAQGGAARE